MGWARILGDLRIKNMTITGGFNSLSLPLGNNSEESFLNLRGDEATPNRPCIHQKHHPCHAEAVAWVLRDRSNNLRRLTRSINQADAQRDGKLPTAASRPCKERRKSCSMDETAGGWGCFVQLIQPDLRAGSRGPGLGVKLHFRMHLLEVWFRARTQRLRKNKGKRLWMVS